MFSKLVDKLLMLIFDIREAEVRPRPLEGVDLAVRLDEPLGYEKFWPEFERALKRLGPKEVRRVEALTNARQPFLHIVIRRIEKGDLVHYSALGRNFTEVRADLEVDRVMFERGGIASQLAAIFSKQLEVKMEMVIARVV